MAVVCTLLASGGFVVAGYVGTSSADAAASLDAQQLIRSSATFEVASLAGFDSISTHGMGANISFAKTLILAKKPPAPQLFDLTDPDGNTPHLARSVHAMRGDIPEVSASLISQVRKDILTAAFQGLGHHYVWGGTSFDHGWDCSGFVQWAYAQAGVALPRTEQWMPMVQTNNPQPGDIVVQNPDGPNHWSHIGIYIGNGKMISALNPSVGTFIHSPADVSSSSAYFTMPAFAAADERAAKNVKEAKGKKDGTGTVGSAKPATSGTPSITPSTKPPTITDPGTTDPGTTAPSTTPPTITDPVTTDPGTTAPTTTPPTTAGPGTTGPGTTPSSTTPPTSTDPGTMAPTSTEPSDSLPSTTPPITSEPPTTEEPSAAELSTPTATGTASADPGVTSPPEAPTPPELAAPSASMSSPTFEGSPALGGAVAP
ncbi:C40 family peptidase [Arthrobacter sp. Sr24]